MLFHGTHYSVHFFYDTQKHIGTSTGSCSEAEACCRKSQADIYSFASKTDLHLSLLESQLVRQVSISEKLLDKFDQMDVRLAAVAAANKGRSSDASVATRTDTTVASESLPSDCAAIQSS